MFSDCVKYIIKSHWYQVLSDLHDYTVLRQECNKAKKACRDNMEVCKHFRINGRCNQTCCAYKFRNDDYVNALEKFEKLTKSKNAFWSEKFSRVK